MLPFLFRFYKNSFNVMCELFMHTLFQLIMATPDNTHEIIDIDYRDLIKITFHYDGVYKSGVVPDERQRDIRVQRILLSVENTSGRDIKVYHVQSPEPELVS